ncbi:HAD family hydrolase [Bacillus spongiae]|uniref:HAD family hydrolase n=1 Tax=Bacillus spongiae TaxID=2683610 RepID=A0ABU8H9G9_9BACI
MIFFDIDATLLDHERAERVAAFEFYNDYTEELQLTQNEFMILWMNHSSTKYYDKYLSKEVSFQEQRRLRMKDLFGHHLNNRQADLKFNDYLLSYRRNWTAYEDAVPCLESLKQLGNQLGIISNGDYTQQIEKIHKIGIGLSKYFSHVITSSEVGVAKPDAKIFIEACKQANVKMEESYYIGDRLEIDAIGSTKAGMRGIWINRKDKTSHNDVIVINNLNELTTLVI